MLFGEILAKKTKIDPIMICTNTITYCRIWQFIYKKKRVHIWWSKISMTFFSTISKRKNPPRKININLNLPNLKWKKNKRHFNLALNSQSQHFSLQKHFFKFNLISNDKSYSRFNISSTFFSFSKSLSLNPTHCRFSINGKNTLKFLYYFFVLI